MVTCSTPLFMVVAFLLLNLATALFHGRNTNTLRDYATNGKRFPTNALVATILATIYGCSSLVCSVDQMYSLGTYWMFTSLLGSFGIWMISRMVLRMTPFIKNLSIAESLGSVYGRCPRVIAAFAGICLSMTILAMQINIVSMTISTFIDSVNPRIITLFATLIFIVYTSFGGMRAITFTGMVQLITFVAIIPLLTWFMFEKIGKSFDDVIVFLKNNEKIPPLSHLFHFDTSRVSLLSLLLPTLLSCVEPSIVQRIYMSSGPIQARRIFLYSSFLHFVIVSFILLIGTFVFANIPDLRPLQFISKLLQVILVVFFS